MTPEPIKAEPIAGEPWDILVSPKVGLVTDLSPQPRGAEEPVPPFLYTATLAHFDFRTADRQERVNAGKGRTEREAKLSALGEAVERYSAYHWDPSRTFVAKRCELGAAISPAECVLYAPEQYDDPGFIYRKWSDEQETMWITGVELPGGMEIALPASLVYLVFPVPRAEDFFTAVTSNGLAAGPTLNAAVLSGLCELIERDALLITWMNKLPATEIEMPEQGFAGAAVLRHYARFGVEVRAFALYTDQLPTVIMAVATESDPARPARLVGMGCDLSPRVALDKAIFELCQGRPSEFIRFHARPPAGRLKSYADVLTLDDHPAFHSLRENSNEFEFLWAAERKVALSAMPDHATGNADTALARCVDRLVATGHRAAYVDITAPDVASAGYRVVRAFATGLQPIHFGWKEARLGGRRLFDAPVAWGLRDTPNSSESLNPCPHPLA